MKSKSLKNSDHMINLTPKYTCSCDICCEKNSKILAKQKRIFLTYVENKVLSTEDKNIIDSQLLYWGFNLEEADLILKKYPLYSRNLSLEVDKKENLKSNEESKSNDIKNLITLFQKYPNVSFKNCGLYTLIKEKFEKIPLKILLKLEYYINIQDHPEFDFKLISEINEFSNKWHYSTLSQYPKIDMDVILMTIQNSEYFYNIRHWKFSIINKSSKMTMEFAEKFMKYKNKIPDFMYNFTALLSQPWMSSSFIEKHICDKFEKLYYIQIYNEISLEKSTKERNKIFSKEIMEVTSQTGYFFKNVLSQDERDELGITDELVEMSKEYPVQLNHKKLIDSIQYV